MRVNVDANLCSACGNCVTICPEVFEIEDDVAVNILGNTDIPAEYEDACREAAEACPMEAIIIEE